MKFNFKGTLRGAIVGGGTSKLKEGIHLEEQELEPCPVGACFIDVDCDRE